MFVNIFPHWEGPNWYDPTAIPEDKAVAFIVDKYNLIKSLYPGKQVIISKTGWPSAGNVRGTGDPNDPAIPSVANEEAFWSQFIPVAQQQGIRFFGFEAFDEPWKSIVEPPSTNSPGAHWGLDDASRVPKGVVTSFEPVTPSGSWLADSPGDFDDPTRWTGNAVPGPTTDATINFPDQPQVTHATGTDTVHSLTNTAGNLIMSGGTLAATTLTNASTMSWTGGALVLNTSTAVSAVFDNAAGASLTIAGNGQQLGVSGTGTATVTNAGTVTLDGAPGETDIDAALINTGSVTVNQGTLSLNGGGSSSGGQLLGSPDGTLRFGTAPGSASALTFSITAGVYAESNTIVDGSTLDLSGAAAAAFGSRLQVSTGALQSGTIAATAYGALTQDGGTIAGTGTLSSSGPVALTGGLQTGSGTTRLTAASTVGGALQLDGARTLENGGFLNWASGDIDLGAGDASALVHSGTLFNAGVLDITGTGRIGTPNGSGTMTNAGVVMADTGAGEADIDAMLHSTGIIQVRSGTFGLNGGGDAWSLSVASGATLQFGPQAGGTTGGAFTAHVAIANAGTVAVTAGRLTLEQGASGPGAFVLDGTATLDFVNGPGGGSSLTFLHQGSTLEVDRAELSGALVSGFGGTDVLDVTPVSFAAAVATFATGTLTVSDGTHAAAFQLAGAYTPAAFHLANDGHGGTAVSYV